MSAHRLLAILILAPAAAFAAGPKETPAPPAPPAPAATGAASSDRAAPDRAERPGDKSASESSEEIRREVDAKVEAAKKELREEIRAQAATQSVAQSWQEEWMDEKRKLELLTLDGYYRVRPDLFHNFDLRRAADPAGFRIFAGSPASDLEPPIPGVNRPLRGEPTIH